MAWQPPVFTEAISIWITLTPALEKIKPQLPVNKGKKEGRMKLQLHSAGPAIFSIPGKAPCFCLQLYLLRAERLEAGCGSSAVIHNRSPGGAADCKF